MMPPTPVIDSYDNVLVSSYSSKPNHISNGSSEFLINSTNTNPSTYINNNGQEITDDEGRRSLSHVNLFTEETHRNSLSSPGINPSATPVQSNLLPVLDENDEQIPLKPTDTNQRTQALSINTVILSGSNTANNSPQPQTPSTPPQHIINRQSSSPARMSLANRSQVLEIKDVISYHNKRIESGSSADLIPVAKTENNNLSPNRHEIIPVDHTIISAANTTSNSVESSRVTAAPTTITSNPSTSNNSFQANKDENNPNENNNTAATILYDKGLNDPDHIFSEEELSFPLTRWRYNLTFPNEKLEAHFNLIYYDKYLLMVRLTTLIIMVVDCLAGITDLYVYQSNVRRDIWILRYSAITPASILYLLITKYFKPFFHYRQIITSIYCIFIGITLMWISAIGQQPNHGIYMILFNVFCLFYGFHYLVSAGVNFSLFVAFNIWNYFVSVVDGERDSSAIGSADYSSSHQWLLSFGYLIVTNLMLLVVGYFIESSFRAAYLQRQRLRCEQKKTNIVLYNILPKNIAQNLVRGIRSADYYHSASILFCDIYDFKPLTTNLSASGLVAMLNDIYSTFDTITNRHPAIKIETIGEVYVVASGLPEENDNHAENCCYLALDLSYIMKDFYVLKNTQTGAIHYDSKRIKREQITGIRTKKEKLNTIKQQIVFRIGIHTGDVIAGVIGVKLPRYRLFGDTINTASRMQSTCLPGRIQVSEYTYSECRQQFIFEDRGSIPVKGKGSMHTYLLQARNAQYEHRNHQMTNFKQILQEKVAQDALLDGEADLTNIIKHGGINIPNTQNNEIKNNDIVQEESKLELARNRGETTESERRDTVPDMKTEIIQNHDNTINNNSNSGGNNSNTDIQQRTIQENVNDNEISTEDDNQVNNRVIKGHNRVSSIIHTNPSNSAVIEIKECVGDEGGDVPAVLKFLRAKSSQTTDGRLISHFDRQIIPNKNAKPMQKTSKISHNPAINPQSINSTHPNNPSSNTNNPTPSGGATPVRRPSIVKSFIPSLFTSQPVHHRSSVADKVDSYEQHNNHVMLTMLKHRRKDSKFNLLLTSTGTTSNNGNENPKLIKSNSNDSYHQQNSTVNEGELLLDECPLNENLFLTTASSRKRQEVKTDK